MALANSTQAEIVRDIEILRRSLREGQNSIVQTAEGNARHLLTQKLLLDKAITDAGDDYAASYGAIAEEITRELAAALTAVDGIVDVTGKTRSELETEISANIQ